MKKYIICVLLFLNFIVFIPITAKNKKLILSNITISIDPGHGGKDVGTSHNKIFEKDINLSISFYLKQKLEKYGAKIIMTREGDYDLASPNVNKRKKSDFNNRIKLINEENTNLFISIHQNYYKNSKYSGTQIFYKGEIEDLANSIQNALNSKRKIKKISNTLYMYGKLKSNGLLIECGFLSNYKDRKNLINQKYQKEYAKKIAQEIIKYYKS